MTKLKKVILIRHGQTTKSKVDEGRKLTTNGVNQITKVALTLKKADLGKGVIVCTPKVRSKMSAAIIARVLSLPRRVFRSNMRVLGIEKLTSLQKKSEDLTFCYLRLVKQNKLPAGITKPVELIKNFNKLIKTYGKFNSLIFVGHSGGLEALTLYKNKFVTKSSPTKELNYGEMIVLTRT